MVHNGHCNHFVMPHHSHVWTTFCFIILTKSQYLDFELAVAAAAKSADLGKDEASSWFGSKMAAAIARKQDGQRVLACC